MVQTQNNLIRSMYAEYGTCEKQATCRTCCNLHYDPYDKKSRICIAYGYDENINCSWNPYSKACGLHNRAFNGLRPRHRTMLEMHPPRRKGPDEVDRNQESMF